MNSYFYGNESVKSEFLSEIHLLFNDGLARNMVLEINSGNEDMLSIISDLRGVGFTFCLITTDPKSMRHAIVDNPCNAPRYLLNLGYHLITL